MTSTPALDAMRARTRGLEEAATPGPWTWDGSPVQPDGLFGAGETVLIFEAGYEIGIEWPNQNRVADQSLIAAFRTDAPRYAALLGVAVEALESVENCADRAGVEIARAALAKIEEMARE